MCIRDRLCVMLGWKWPSGSGENFQKLSILSCLLYTSPSPRDLSTSRMPSSAWKNAWPLIWTNLNSLYPRILCVMFSWNWSSSSGENFQKLSIFFHFCYYLPLEKGQGPSFERNWIPLTERCSVPSLVEIGPVALENKSSMCFHYVDTVSYTHLTLPTICSV